MKKILPQLGLTKEEVYFNQIHTWIASKIELNLKKYIRQNIALGQGKARSLKKQLDLLKQAPLEKQLVPESQKEQYNQFKQAMIIMTEDIIVLLTIPEKPIQHYYALQKINEYIQNNQSNINRAYFKLKKYNSAVEKINKLILNTDIMAAKAVGNLQQLNIETYQKIYSLIKRVNEETEQITKYLHEKKELDQAIKRNQKKLENQLIEYNKLETQSQPLTKTKTTKKQGSEKNQIGNLLKQLKELNYEKKLTKAQQQLLDHTNLTPKHIRSLKAIQKKNKHSKPIIDKLIENINKENSNIKSSSNEKTLKLQNKMITQTRNMIENLENQMLQIESLRERINPSLTKQKVKIEIEKIDKNVRVIT